MSANTSGLYLIYNRKTGKVKYVTAAPGDMVTKDHDDVVLPLPPLSPDRRKKLAAEVRPLAKRVQAGARYRRGADGQQELHPTWSGRRTQRQLERLVMRRTRGARLRAWASDHLREWASETVTGARRVSSELRETLAEHREDWREHRAYQREHYPTRYQQWRTDRRAARQERDRQHSWDKAAAQGVITPEQADELRAHPELHDEAAQALRPSTYTGPWFGSAEGLVARDTAMVSAHSRDGRPVRAHVRHLDARGRRS